MKILIQEIDMLESNSMQDNEVTITLLGVRETDDVIDFYFAKQGAEVETCDHGGSVPSEWATVTGDITKLDWGYPGGKYPPQIGCTRITVEMMDTEDKTRLFKEWIKFIKDEAKYFNDLADEVETWVNTSPLQLKLV